MAKSKGADATKKAEAKEAKRDYIVSCRADGKWTVKREGARCASKTVASRAEAEAAAQELAEKEGVQVIVRE
ncbi:MAG: DUF2188 domain-containing protein [Anaerolineae bacterium]